MVLNGPSLTDFQKTYKKHVVFDDFLLQKAVSVDSFTKMDAKWPRARFGLGRIENGPSLIDFQKSLKIYGFSYFSGPKNSFC